MKAKFKYIFIIILLFFSIIVVWWWFNNIYNWDWVANIWVNDSLTSSKIWFDLISYDKFSNEYIENNKRMYFQNSTFTSEVYWDFSTNWIVDLYKSDNVNTNCLEETVSYYFKWSFINDDWWSWFETIKNDNNNYFCPDSWKFSIHLKSDNIPNAFFEDFVITNENDLWYIVLKIEDVNWDEVEIDERVIFSSMKLSVSWNVNFKPNINDEFWWWSINQQYTSNINFIDYNIWVWKIYSQIKKNIYKITRAEEWSTNLYNINNFLWNNLFDYSWQNTWFISNSSNKWQILNIWYWSGEIEVDWEKHVIVKWGNIYIKNDIYNNPNNDESILTIIALRDKNNPENWWNIYIDPYVTNIDAVLIAEGSIMSYNWSTTLNSTNVNSVNLLRNQLLIYWSIISRNTIWNNIAPYNSDDYIKNWWEVETPKYNLENLRSFQVVRSNQIIWECDSYWWEVSAIGDNEYKAKKFAFAWKKECYLDDLTYNNLRSTHRTASTVIEYNPVLHLNPPRILNINN